MWLQCEWKEVMFGLFSQHAHCFVQVWTIQGHWGHLVMSLFYYGSEVTLFKSQFDATGKGPESYGGNLDLPQP